VQEVVTLLLLVVVIMEELNSVVVKLLKSAQESASIEGAAEVEVVIFSPLSGLFPISQGFEVSIGIGAADEAFVAHAIKHINHYLKDRTFI
jgi:hypothetical protein